MKLSNMSTPNVSSSAFIQQTEVLMKEKQSLHKTHKQAFFISKCKYLLL